jgi:hypothetical protein
MSREVLKGFRHVCPVCGKDFTAQSSWAYQEKRKNGGNVYYCSWKCKRMNEHGEKEKQAAGF